MGSRSTKPAREVRLLLEIPLSLRRRTTAALRRLRTGFDSRRRDRWDGATVAHEFHTLGIGRFNSDPSNADDPRRDARFISAAAEVRVPSSALERRLTAGRWPLTPFISVRIRALQQRHSGVVQWQGPEPLELVMGVRIPPPEQILGDKAQGGPRASGARAGGFDPRVSDHHTGGEAAGEASGPTNRNRRVRSPGLLPIRRRPVAVARPYKRAISVRLRGGGRCDHGARRSGHDLARLISVPAEFDSR